MRFERARELADEHGPAGLIRYVLHRAGWRRVVLFEQYLAEPTGEDAEGAESEIRRLEEADLAAHERLQPAYPEAELRRRLREGDVCIATWRREQIVGSVWMRFGTVSLFGLRLEPCRDALVVYDHFVAPAQRQHGVASAQSNAWRRYAKAAGYRRAVYGVFAYNRPGLRTARRMAPSDLGVLGSILLGQRFRVTYLRRRGRRMRMWWGITPNQTERLTW
jgi:GNAT superfamily N-acetyltransferase